MFLGWEDWESRQKATKGEKRETEKKEEVQEGFWGWEDESLSIDIWVKGQRENQKEKVKLGN